MRPLLDTADVMQPSLNMLNPTLDEFLDSLDSMDSEWIFAERERESERERERESEREIRARAVSL